MKDTREVKDIINRVVTCKKEGDYTRAQDLLEQALAENPDNASLKVSLADLLLRRKQLVEAVHLADEVLGRDPGDYRALLVKGDAAYHQRNYKEAADYYRQAYKRKETPFLARRLIQALNRNQEWEQSLGLCQEWLEREPDNNFFKKIRAGIYEKMGKTEQAARDYDKYLKERPQDEFAYKEAIKLKLKGKPPEIAVKELRRLLQVGERRENVHLHTLLAGQLEKLEEYDEAVSQYQKALSLAPGDPFVLKQLGYCLTRANREKEALPYLEEAFKNDPSDYYIRSSLLSLYKKLAEIPRGLEFFRDIIRNNPSFRNLWGIIKKLGKEVNGDAAAKED